MNWPKIIGLYLIAFPPFTGAMDAGRPDVSTAASDSTTSLPSSQARMRSSMHSTFTSYQRPCSIEPGTLLIANGGCSMPCCVLTHPPKMTHSPPPTIRFLPVATMKPSLPSIFFAFTVRVTLRNFCGIDSVTASCPSPPNVCSSVPPPHFHTPRPAGSQSFTASGVAKSLE